MKTSMVLVLPVYRRTFKQNGYSIKSSQLFVHMKVREPEGIFKKVGNPFLYGFEAPLQINEDRFTAACRAVENFTNNAPKRENMRFVGTVDFGLRRHSLSQVLAGEKVVRLYIYKWYVPEALIAELDEIDQGAWYQVDGRYLHTRWIEKELTPATILPSDQHWLIHFLIGNKVHRAKIYVRDDFSVTRSTIRCTPQEKLDGEKKTEET